MRCLLNPIPWGPARVGSLFPRENKTSTVVRQISKNPTLESPVPPSFLRKHGRASGRTATGSSRRSSSGSGTSNSTMPAKKISKRKSDAIGVAHPNTEKSRPDDEDDTAFPRGGGNVLSRSEVKAAQTEAEVEFLLEERARRVQKKSKRTKAGLSQEDDFGSLFGDGVTGKSPKFVNKITLKNVSAGMKMLGAICEVNPKDLVVSLPGGLRGYVRAEEASDLLVERKSKDFEIGGFLGVFLVGQIVPCIVVEVENHDASKRILLSLRLSLLNKGLTLDLIQEGMVMNANVKSIEDHGYILHLGSTSFSGFLPRSNGTEEGNHKVEAGQLLQVVVCNIDKSRKVISFRSSISTCLTKEYRGLSVDLLLPGMLVEAHLKFILANGVLVSFLSYFTGTVDIFNLQDLCPTSSWKDSYHIGARVRARILFIDPVTRAVGLTMNPHLLLGNLPPSHVKSGDIFEDARVVRLDRGTGLLLEIPSFPGHTPGYVKILEATNEETPKLEKKFKEGKTVRVRVLDFRQMEGLAICSLKESALETSFFTHADIKPGMVVKGKVIKIENDDAVVQFLGSLKAICPLQHMSELNHVKPPKKFKDGAHLIFRVLGCKSKRITLTHKRTLVKSKLNIIASYDDAVEGLITHGWITKIENYGCFVRFYNGVQGLCPISELGVDQIELNSCFHVGQVVKCKVTSAIPASHRINLTFMTSSARTTIDAFPELGSIVTGVVESISPSSVIVNVDGKKHMKGTIATEHLSDHLGQANHMKLLIKPGYEFNNLMVLDTRSKTLILSAKYSLIHSTNQIPSSISQVQVGSVVQGYICNVIETGCFIRFLGSLTGFAPKKKGVDSSMHNLCEFFSIGQSVRSHIFDVDAESGRIGISLKQSSCYSVDASLIQGFFLLVDEIAKRLLSQPEDPELAWMDSFVIGSNVMGHVQEIKEFGVVVSFKAYPDLVGFISNYQLGGANVEIGCMVQAMVLDISKIDNIVDLSLRHTSIEKQKAFKKASSKKRSRGTSGNIAAGDIVDAVVELIKESYLVLSLPEHGHAIGYAFLSDYNTQQCSHRQYVEGERLVAVVGSLPGPSSPRLLLILKSLSEDAKNHNTKKARRKSSFFVGSLVEAEITNITLCNMFVKFGDSLKGTIHITEVYDTPHSCLESNPFSKYRVGETLTARIVAKASKSKTGSSSHPWELSIRPSVVTDHENATGILERDSPFSVGQNVIGYVIKLDDEWAHLALSHHVQGDLFVLDTSTNPSELQEFQKRFRLGQPVSCCILSLNKEKKHRLRVALKSILNQLGDEELISSDLDHLDMHIREGAVLGGRIAKVLPGVGGLLVQLGPHVVGKVHFTELNDLWVSNPMDGYLEGQFVKCMVLEAGRSARGTFQVDLSLRQSLFCSQSSGNPSTSTLERRFTNVDDLYSNMEVTGYVKEVTEKGCFIMLSRKVDARILPCNLSDGFIEVPAKEFPVGKLVHGKVLSVETLSKRVELTLKSKNRPTSNIDINNMHSLKVGDIITGKIRRIESYGLFIKIDDTHTVGLCHISEVSDDKIENLETKFHAGEKVTAKVLEIDVERDRVSLGCKPSYLDGYLDGGDFLSNDISEPISRSSAALDPPSNFVEKNGNASVGEISVEDNLAMDQPIPYQVRSRTSVLPLEVTLDDDMEEINDTDQTTVSAISSNHNTCDEAHEDKKRRHLKRKAKEERERQIMAAEDKHLNEDSVPTSSDDFEKLVRSSPNSSYLWIKYMAFSLSLRDIPKARAIAERALNTINIREEGEKLNVWVAYLNLENEYGSPRKEAVEKIFERACQSCDSKKVHLALLGTYERTEQQELSNELIKKMTKKFKTSCKVWLRYIESLLKQGSGDAQSVVNRALLSLGQWKHIKFISQAAILEFKHGMPDRGRSMFEKVLREYPKRMDLWNVYLDQEIHMKDHELVRSLFERATSLNLPRKKMKFLFKKYLDYEKLSGDEERVDYVKRKAMEYVENSQSS